ncbi:MAG: sugar transferase [Solirubrobacterales bacterium]
MELTSSLREATTGAVPARTADDLGISPSETTEVQENGARSTVTAQVATVLPEVQPTLVPEVQPSGDGAVIAPRVPALPKIQIRRRAAWTKRAFDLVASTLLLLVLAPLLLLIALAIKLDSRGPVLFRQRRVGRGGEVFEMFKFRTMVRDAELVKQGLRHLNEAPDGLFKITRDPRTTRFGALLRATSLDELPQLLHVISGRMSLVGPRPLVPQEDALIKAPYRRRLEMPPGMTGPWQVAGASKVPLARMVELDYEYVSGWSLLGDVKVLLGTFPHVLLRRGI